MGDCQRTKRRGVWVSIGGRCVAASVRPFSRGKASKEKSRTDLREQP